MVRPGGDAGGLAARLRELRTTEFGIPLTQLQLAGALGVSVPLISSWEKSRAAKVPPPDRLAAYARFFATPRSVDDDRPRLREDLTEDEERRRTELEHELGTLRGGSLPAAPAPIRDGSPAAGLWHFADGAPISIVCGTLPEDLRADEAYVNPDSPDYVELYSYADLDALIELYGHVRAANPDSQVTFSRASLDNRDLLTTHLVLLGGVDWNGLVGEVLDKLRVPVRQFVREGEQAAFEVGVDGASVEYRPVLRSEDGHRVLVEDVALFCRGPNPFNRLRTVTICNGQFGRGTYGMVRALTDSRFRDRNAGYVRRRFRQDRPFSILGRVQVVSGQVVTPDWTQEQNIVHEWTGTE